MITSEVVYGAASGRPLRLDVCSPDTNRLRTAVLQLHGGGFRRGHRKLLAPRSEELCELGFVCLAVEYRLIHEARWPAQLHDVKAAIVWARLNAGELGIHPDRIVVQGYSAGARLALVAAGTADQPSFTGDNGSPGVSSAVAAVVACYTPLPRAWTPTVPSAGEGSASVGLPANRTVPAWLGPTATRADVEAADPMTYMRAGFPPTCFIRGSADTLVAVEASRRLHARLIQAGVETDLHVYAGQPHEFDTATPFLELVQFQSAVFFRTCVSEPEAIRAEQVAANPILRRSNPCP
jgi:acetyl esterase/lipase